MPPGFDPTGFISNTNGDPSGPPLLVQDSAATSFNLGDNLIQATLNEISLGNDYSTTLTTGGTVALSATQFHQGAQSLRVNRTSNNEVYAHASVGAGVRTIKWSFWMYVAAMPTATLTPVAKVRLSGNRDLEIRMDPSGVLYLMQGSTLTNRGSTTTALAVNTWNYVEVTFDTSTAQYNGTLQVNGDGNVLNVDWGDAPTDILGVRYGSSYAGAPTVASTYDIYYDEGYIWSIPSFRTALLQAHHNEGLTISSEYGTSSTSGGTVTLSTAQFHDGTQSLRINRTSAAIVYAETNTITLAIGPGNLQHAELCGSFWIRVASYPTGVGDSGIFSVFHPLGDNLELSLSNTGQVRARRQDTVLVSVKEQSSYSATSVALNTWTQIFWSMDGNQGTLIGTVQVGSDPAQTVSWTQTAEVPSAVDYGSRNLTATSLYDIYFDEGRVYEGLVYPVTVTSGTGALLAVTSPGSASATTASAFRIQLPARTTAGVATYAGNNVKIKLPPVSVVTGASATTAQAFRIRLPSRTSAGVATATPQAFLIKLPSRTTAGVGTLAASPSLRIRFPNVATAGAGTASASIRIRLSTATSAGSSTATASALKVRLPSRTTAGSGTSTAQAFRISLPSRATAGIGSLTATPSLRIQLPARSSAGTSTSTATALRLGLHATSAGTSTATAVAFRIRLPNLTSAGTGALSANNIKIRLPVRTTAGVATASTSLSVRLPVRTSAGSSTSTATAFLVRLPSRTVAGVGTLSGNSLKIQLPARTSVGTGTLAANNVKIQLPNVFPDYQSPDTPVDPDTPLDPGQALIPPNVISTATATALRIRLPSRTSQGTSTSIATAFLIRLPARTSAGVGTADETALQLTGGSSTFPAVTSNGTSTGTATGLRIRLPARSSAGTSTATAAAFRIRLPNQTSVGVGTLAANNVKIRLPARTTAGVATGTTSIRLLLPARTSAGTSTATAVAFRIRLPNLTSAGVGSLSGTTIKIRLPARSSAGVATGTTSLSVRLPARTSAGVATGTTSLSIRLPARTSAGTSTATAAAFKERLANATSAGVGTLSGNNLKIKLPARTSAGVGTGTAVALSLVGGGTFTFPVRTSAGTSTATAAAFRIRLPARSTAGVGALSGSLRIRLPARSSAGTSTATATAFRIRLQTATAAGVATTTETYTQAVTADVPVAWWHLDETAGTNATDSIGGNTGTYSGATLNQPSLLPFGGGVSVDFGNHAGKVNVTDVFDFAGNVPYSIELWWKPQNVDIAFHTIMGKEVTATRDGWDLGYTFTAGSGTQGPNSGHLTWSRWNTNVQQQTTWPTTAVPPQIQQNRSYHIVGTYDGATLKLYVNGVLATTGGAAATAIIDTAAGLCIGAISTNSGSSTQGLVDEVAVYDYSLTLSQIKSHYSAANGSSLQIRMPTVSLAGVGALTQSGIRIQLPNRTSAGVATATASIRLLLPARTTAGVGTATAQALRIKLPARTSAGIATASTALRIRFPSQTSSGVGSLAGNNVKIRLPARASAGTSTATATGLRPRLSTVTTAGASTATAQALRIRLPARTSAGVASSASTALQVRLPSRTSPGVGSLTGNNLKVQLPARTSAGSSNTTATAVQTRLASTTSAGAGALTQAGIRIRLPSQASAGTGSTADTLDLFIRTSFGVLSQGRATATAQAFLIRLPAIGERLFFPDDLFDPDQPANTNSGIGTATARMTVFLPAQTASGSSTTSTTFLQVALPKVGERLFSPDDPFDPDQPANTNSGIGTATATALQIRLPSMSASGTSTATAPAFLETLSQLTSNGVGTATALGLRIRLPARSSAGAAATTSTTSLQIRLPNRSTAGASTSTATALRIRLPSRTSQGTSTATAPAFRIRMVPVSVAGVGAVFGNNVRIQLPARSVAGMSTSTARITLQLPKIGGYGTLPPDYPLDPDTPLLPSGYLGNSTATAQPLQKGLHVFTSGVGTATAPAFRIRLPANQTHGTSKATIHTLHIFFPPPKTVEASEGQHVQIASEGQHAITVSRVDQATAGLGGHVATAGSGSHTVIERP